VSDHLYKSILVQIWVFMW